MFFWKRKKSSTGLSSSLEQALAVFKKLLTNDGTIVYRMFQTAGPHPRECALIYAENMIKHEFLSHYVLLPLMESALPRKLSGPPLARYLAEGVIPSDGVEFKGDYQELAHAAVSGSGVILVDGCNLGIVVAAQGWAKRQVTEPKSESVVRGPRQGFAEDLGVNIGLVRRIIRSPQLKIEYKELGEQTRTKIAIVYVQDIASQLLIDEVLRRIEEIEIDAILESGYIEELIQDSPRCPFPTIGHTERPDVVAGKILEGRVAVLVDGTPFALTMPYLFLESFQANEDYYHHWIAASFHRFLRYICFGISTITPAFYLALITYHPQLIPTNLVLSISAARKNVPFPGLVEVILMGLIFEILREGGVRLPQPVGQAISIVGAIVLGDAAVGASLVSAPMIIVVAITGIAGFVVSPLYDTAVLIRLFLALAAAFLGLYGLIFGIIGIVLQLASMKSFDVPYLSSLTAFRLKDLKDTTTRLPWWSMVLRPRNLSQKNRKRLQGRTGKSSE